MYFELKNKSIIKRIYSIYAFYFIGTIAFIIVLHSDMRLFMQLDLILFMFISIRLIFRRNRFVYKVSFNEIENNVKIFYYQYIFLKFNKVIPYSEIKFIYKRKLYGRTAFKVLDIVSKEKLVAGLFENEKVFLPIISFGWEKRDIDNIIKVIKKNQILIKQFINKIDSAAVS